MKASDLFNKAAEVMLERGHGKGNFVDRDGRVCLFGACYVAAGVVTKHEHGYSTVGTDGVNEVLMPFLRQLVPQSHGFRGLGSWNDDPATTEAMVLSLLHEAARLAKEEGE